MVLLLESLRCVDANMRCLHRRNIGQISASDEILWRKKVRPKEAALLWEQIIWGKQDVLQRASIGYTRSSTR